jgi:AraC-like DNA-binding protein
MHYSLIFRKALKQYNNSIDNYFSETGTIRLKWIKIAFLSALIIGLLAVIFQTLPSLLFDNIFTTVLVVFYTAFALNFINYKKIYHLIEPAFNNEVTNEAEIETLQVRPDWNSYKLKILENKFYLKKGITLTDLAQSLNVSRTALTNFINIEEHRNFNTWINQLRISDTQKANDQ